MTELITSSSGNIYTESKIVDSNTGVKRGSYKLIDYDYSIKWKLNDRNFYSGFSINHETGFFKTINNHTNLPYDSLDELNTPIIGIKLGISDKQFNSNGLSYDKFEELNSSTYGVMSGTHPVDSDGAYVFRLVDLRFDKIDPTTEFRYLPTSDFNITIEKISFTTDFVEPLDLSKSVSRLSSVDSGNTLTWRKNQVKDIYQELNYGYSINNFLVGGSVRTDYPVADDAINPPIEPPISAGVVKIVNVINVVKLPERTPIDFVDFTLTTDLDSIAWVVNFTIGSQASLDILKPIGLTTVDVEININGEIFICFIGRTTTNFSTNNGGLKKTWKCTGWSYSKLLTYPYSAKRSHTELSSSTPAGLLTAELSGTGFTGVWNSVSWTIPPNVFSYLEKTPLAAITELTEAIGGVIIPDPSLKSISIEKYYSVNPWDWGITTADFNLNETEFYSMDTNWLPKESPDSIFVYGEETGGVAVKGVRQGTAGLITLPTVVNKYITDTIAGTERARIEIAKNGFKEIIPVTTYVDSIDGIIKPQSLLSITPLSGITWKGFVVGTSISIKRQGTAVIQSLQIERHYD